MTVPADNSDEFVATSQVIESFDVAAFNPSTQGDALGEGSSDEPVLPVAYGWQSLVEVDVDEQETISASYIPGHEDQLKASDAEVRRSGFYTMRYNFVSDSEFRPYAGAGVGVVTAEDRENLTGAVAARAVAGFDIEVDENAGFFAEYAFLKSTGSVLGESGAASASLSLPDDEHSIKLGFRRTF